MSRKAFGVFGKLGLGLAAGKKPFSPADLNPVAWYDFSDASLLFTDAGTTNVSSDGDAIFQANDKSVNGNNLVQSTLAKRPLYKLNIKNNLSAGVFDGVDDLMISSGLSVTQPNTVVLVTRNNQVGGTQFFFDGNPNRQAIIRSSINLQAFAGSTVTVATPFTFGFFDLHVSLFDGTSSKYFVNGVDKGTFNFGIQGLSSLVLGSRFDEINHSQNDFAEVLFIPSPLSDNDLTALTNFLNKKWGIF